MRQRTILLATLVVLLGGAAMASAQSGLVAGGLTKLPEVRLGPDLLKNGGFETLEGGVPANWSTGGGWGVDQLEKREGAFSYRRTTGAPSANQSLRLKKGVYKLSAWIKTEGLGSANAGVRLQVDYRPAINDWVKTEIISGTRDWTLFELRNVVVSDERTVTVRLENYGNPAGTAWFDSVKLEEQLPDPLNVYLLYPNYRGMLFDDKPQTMKFDLTVTPPVGDLARYRVSGTLKDEATGQAIETDTFPAAANFVANLDGSGMQPGRGYLATFSLVDGSTGAAVYTYPAYRVSKVPAAVRQSMNIAFDEKNRVLINGQPRFVLGIYDSGGSYSTSDAYYEEALWSPTGSRRLDGIKFNFYLNYWYGQSTAESMKALMSNLQKRGVMYLQTGNCFNTGAAGSQFFINSSDGYVQDIGSHEGSAGYYTADECVSTLMPGVFDQYQRLKRLDPDSMTFAALFGHPDIVLWRDAADILSSDPYPMFGAEPAGGYYHKTVADWTARTREAVKDARPIMTVLQFFKFTSQGRWPTRTDLRNHAGMAIVEGARGLWWWAIGNGNGALAAMCSGWCDEKTAHMADLKAVVNEIADLEPALLADDAEGALTGNSNPSAIRTKVKVVNGRGYVFAYNATNATAQVTFGWHTAPGTVTVNGEGRTLATAGNSFTDTFGPFQAHVYVLGSGGSTTPPPDPIPDPLGVTFANPANGATLSGTATVTMAATGGTGYTYRVAANGQDVYTGTNASFSLNTANLANGSVTLSGTVTDAQQRTATATITVTVSNGGTAPPPPPPPPPAGEVTVTFPSLTAGQIVSGTPQVTITAAGMTGTVNRFYISVDGVQKDYWVVAGTTINWFWNTSSLADGAHTLSVKAVDVTGKTGTGSIVVQKGSKPIPPPTPGPLTLTFSSPASGATLAGMATVTMSATGGNDYTYSLAVDGQNVSTGTTPTFSLNTATLANGSHTLTGTVTDGQGRSATVSLTVTVANPPAPPTGPITVTFPSLAAGETVSGTRRVTITATGTSGSQNRFYIYVDNVQRDFWIVPGQTIHWFWRTSALSIGNHTLTVKVVDATGKTGTASIVVVRKGTTAAAKR
jgi:hypothetical protein